MYGERFAPLSTPKTSRQTHTQTQTECINIGRLTLWVNNGRLKVLLRPANGPWSSNIVHKVFNSNTHTQTHTHARSHTHTHTHAHTHAHTHTHTHTHIHTHTHTHARTHTHIHTLLELCGHVLCTCYIHFTFWE